MFYQSKKHEGDQIIFVNDDIVQYFESYSIYLENLPSAPRDLVKPDLFLM